MDPRKTAHVPIDRFSAAAGHLKVSDSVHALPGPIQPVDFDKGLFVSTGLEPGGKTVMYYDFAVRSTTPAPIRDLFRRGVSGPVEGTLNMVDAISGNAGYNDFRRVNKVTVPADYRTNTEAGPRGAPSQLC